MNLKVSLFYMFEGFWIIEIFFYCSLQPIPLLHIAARDFTSSQRNASEVTPIGRPFSELPIAVQCLRGSGVKK